MRFQPYPLAFSLPFLDICLQRSPDAEIANNFLWAGFVMSMAVAVESRAAQASPGRIGRVEIRCDLSEAEAIWRELEQQFATPFQRFDFLAAWQREVGGRENLSPFIVIACDAERRPLMLLPLALGQRRGIRTASFMGGKHATFNMPLYRPGFAERVTPADLEALVSAIREQAAADVLALVQQPNGWQGLSNPMMLLSHQPSVNDCPLLTMPARAAPTDLISNSFRKRLEGKERKLKKLPGYRY